MRSWPAFSAFRLPGDVVDVSDYSNRVLACGQPKACRRRNQPWQWSVLVTVAVGTTLFIMVRQEAGFGSNKVGKSLGLLGISLRVRESVGDWLRSGESDDGVALMMLTMI